MPKKPKAPASGDVKSIAKPSAKSPFGTKLPYLISVTPWKGDPATYAYSNSRLVNINQCPTYGVVSNQRRYATTTKAIPLLAGAAMHEVFAAIRLWQLEHIQKLPKHAKYNAERLFGIAQEGGKVDNSRWLSCVSHTKDKRDNLLELCFAILHSSGYEDNGNDKVRTISNMEMAAIAYADERLAYAENWPIWVADKKNPQCQVGIEQPFDVCLTYSDGRTIRYIGTIDGLVENLNRKRYEIDENKTASRLDDAWRNSFDMSMQLTGYCAASTTVFGFQVLHQRVTGLMLRPSKEREQVMPVEPLARDAYSILHWGHWVRHTADMYELYKDNYEQAPRYTHSCSRYFRPCALIPFCCDTPDGRKQQWNEMVEADLSPSEQAVLGD